MVFMWKCRKAKEVLVNEIGKSYELNSLLLVVIQNTWMT